MNKTQYISMKVINGEEVFKINDVKADTLVNLRLVKKIGNKYRVITELSQGEHEFAIDRSDIELYEGDNVNHIQDALKEHQDNVKKNFTNILNSLAYIAPESIEIRDVSGHTFALSVDERFSKVPNVNYAIGDTEGKIIGYGPIRDQSTLYLATLNLLENPYREEIYFRTGESDYLALVKHQAMTIAVPLMLQQDKEGVLSWSSNADYFDYFLVRENEVLVVPTPNTAFNSDEEIQSFIEKVAKEASERIIVDMPNFVE